MVFLSEQNILRSAAALTFSGIIAKTADFIFRAYYSTRLGSEGMGIFSLVFSYHSIILTFATGGLGVAVSKSVSEQFSYGCSGNVKKVMRIALTSVFVLSIAVIVATCIFSSNISGNFLNEPRTRLSLICLSPSILFMSISYCIKGYFYASRKVLIPATSEFLEQAVKITVITLLLKKALPLGITAGCAAVFLGISVGELSSCLYLIFFYRKDCPSLKRTCETGSLAGGLLKIALPSMLTSLSGSILRMQENVLIVTGLKKSGLTNSEALSQYGTVHGMVMPLIIFPLTLLSSCFTLLVPEISRANAIKNRLRLSTLISRLYRFTAFGSFLVCTVFVTLPTELATLVYSAPNISKTVFLIALFSPVMFADSVSCGILNGLGKQTTLLILSFCDSFLRIGLIVFLIPAMGINALFIMIFTSNIFTASCTVETVLRTTGIPFEFSGWFFRHLLSAILTNITVNSLWGFFCSNTGTPATIGAIIFTVLVYILYSSCLSRGLRHDMLWLRERMFTGNSL